MPTEDVPIDAWMESHRVTIEPVDETKMVGIGHALDACRSVLGRLRHAEAVVAAGAAIPRGILLCGPAGVGKTLTARWLAGQLGDIPAFDLPTEQLDPPIIRAAFAYLAGLPTRSVVFLSEIDAIGLERRGNSDRESKKALYAILESLDGLVANRSDRGPIVIATSNREPYALDDALTRPGRLGIHVRFATPTEAERIALFAVMSAGRPQEPTLDWARMAALTRDWTPAAIRAAIDDAHGMSLLRDGAAARLTDALLVDAIRRAGEVEPDPGEGAEMSRERIAVHEAGHTAVAVALGLPVMSVRIGPGRRQGRTETGIEGTPSDDAELRASLIVAFGGAAAERLVLGEASLGAGSDVHGASRIVLERIAAGIDPNFDPISRDAFGQWAPRVVDDRIATYAMECLAVARDRAAAIVAGQLRSIEAFAARLLDVDLLAGDELIAAMRAVGWKPVTKVESERARVIEGEQVA